MNIEINPGRYILAVSGGVDSMVLLDILRKKSGLELIIAHFNHGIRADSDKDEALVRKVAKKYNLQLEVGKGNLGVKTSEDKARQARYAFLRAVKSQYKAKLIIIAHHQDDLIETALLNILRGTGTRGLTAISRNPQLTRPMLDIPKKEIVLYAKKHGIAWREDASNKDIKPLRNYVRHRLMPKLTPEERTKLLQNIDKVAIIEKRAESIIATLSQRIKEKDQISRRDFTQLPPEVADELMLYWLRQQRTPNPDRKTIQRLSLAIKTARPGTAHSVRRGLWLTAGPDKAHFTTTVPKGLL